MKVAISTSSFAFVDSAPLEYLKAKGLEVLPNPYGRKMIEEEIIDHLKGVDGLLAGLESLNSNVFKKCPRLKAIARIGIGMDNVDIKVAKKYDIKVSNTPDAPTEAVAELTLAAALTLSRNIISSNSALHKKLWQKSIGLGLKNTNVLFIGYGRIGRKTAELFRALGAHIFVSDPALNQSDLMFGEKFVQLNDGLKSANIITLHAGGNKPILTALEFEQMQNGVIILNSARGTLIDEKALITALELRKVASVWMDVFPEEPYNGKLTEYEQALLTPHISTYTTHCRGNMEMAAVKNLLRDLKIES